MIGKNVEHAQPVFDPPAGRNSLAEDDLLTLVMQAGTKDEARVRLRHDRPSGEATRYLGHIFLRVSAIDAERVQFHQLATVIFVQSRPARRYRISIGILSDRWFNLTQEVVEVIEHRRALRRGDEQLFKFS